MKLLTNKKALLRFSIIETFPAGMELFGSEVKSLREGHGSLDGSHIVVRGGEAFIVGMTIPPYQASNTSSEYDPERARRLLLQKQEISQLADAESKKGLTIIPIEVYNTRGLLKISVAIVRGKGKHDHREDIKKREADIEAQRAIKNT